MSKYETASTHDEFVIFWCAEAYETRMEAHSHGEIVSMWSSCEPTNSMEQSPS